MTGLVTDQWLRTEFQDHARTIDPPADLHSETLRRARATRTRRKGIQTSLMVGLAAVVTGVVVIVVGAPSSSTKPEPADQVPPPPSGPEVEVSWGWAYVSDPVTFDDMAQNLREHGLGEWVEPLYDKWGNVDGQIRLDFQDGGLTASIPGTQVSQTNDYSLLNDHLYLYLPDGADAGFDAGFKATSATELDAGGQRLSLTLQKSSKESRTAPTDGIPGEVYERALYTTVPFNEIPPSATAPSAGIYQTDSVRFGRIADFLRFRDLGGSVEPLREMWGNVGGPVPIRLELDGDTATLSIPGTQITFTGPYTTDGSLIRIEDDDPRDDNGWIELKTCPGCPSVAFGVWNEGPAAWDGLPAKAIAVLLTTNHFTATPYL